MQLLFWTWKINLVSACPSDINDLLYWDGRKKEKKNYAISYLSCDYQTAGHLSINALITLANGIQKKKSKTRKSILASPP